MNDLRYAIRMLGKNPGFTAVAVLSLALGIGANTAVFSLLNAVLLRSLPVRDPQLLRVLNWDGLVPRDGCFPGGSELRFYGLEGVVCGGFSYPLYRAFREEGQGFVEIFAFTRTDPLTVVTGSGASTAHGMLVSGNFFAGYGVSALLGRPITPEDERPGAPPVVVITYRAWERHFGLDPLVIGQAVTLNQTSFTLIGVLPRRYAGPIAGDAADFYVPLTYQPQFLRDWPLLSTDHYWLQVMLRLPPGAAEAHARASLEVVLRQVQSSLSKPNAAPPKLLLKEGWRGPQMRREAIARQLHILKRIVALVLLIACVNLAGLLLARNARRQHELAVRAALGAGRWRLLRQCFSESLVLTLAGAALGLVLAYWGKAGLANLLPGLSDDVHFDPRLDLRVLTFTFGMTMVAALLSGGLPALVASRVPLAAGLQSARVLGAPRLRLGKLMVIAQVAMTLVLVAGAGMMVRSVVNLHRIDLGFDAQHLTLFKLNAAQAGHPKSQLAAFYDGVREAVAAIPGVRATAYSDQSQVGAGCWNRRVDVPGRPEAEIYSGCMVVSDSFFATMQIPLLFGRSFSGADSPGPIRVAVVNRAFVETIFPGEEAVGRFFKSGGEEYQIAGVCGNARYDDVRQPLEPMMYLPYRQALAPEVWFEVQSVLPPLALAPAVRQIVTAADPNIALAAFTTQRALCDRRIATQRMFAALGGVLAALAVLLSCIGIYGLMAYNVACRTAEMGIRMALGARREDVSRPILGEAAWLASAGAVLGIPLSWAAVRIIRHYLYGISPHDLFTFAGATVVLIAVAVLAAWLPARRAARVDPMVALRTD
jgi:predicted permease